MTATPKVYARRLAIARRVVRGYQRPLDLGRLYRVPYRLLIPGINAGPRQFLTVSKPLIHNGRKP